MSYESIGNYQPTSTWPSTRNDLSCIETGGLPFDTTGTTSDAERFLAVQELFRKGHRDRAFSEMYELLGPMAKSFDYLRALRILLHEGEARPARLLATEAHGRFPENSRIAKIYEVLRPPTARYTTGKAIDRRREVQWLREHGREYQGKWVALSGDLLLAASERVGEALEEAKHHQLSERPLLYYVSKSNAC